MPFDFNQAADYVHSGLNQLPSVVVDGFALFGILCVFLMFIRFFAWILVPGSYGAGCDCPVGSLIDMHRQVLSNISSTQSQILSAFTNFQTKALTAIQEVAQSAYSDDD